MKCPSCDKALEVADVKAKQCNNCHHPIERVINIGTGHYGKAMISVVDNSAEVIIACSICGDIKIGPLHLAHLPSFIAMLQKVCDSVGIVHEGTSIASEKMLTTSKDAIDEIREQFSKVTLEESRELAEKYQGKSDIPDGVLDKLAEDPWKN